MDYDKNICPIVDVEGVIENGKQFDIDVYKRQVLMLSLANLL